MGELTAVLKFKGLVDRSLDKSLAKVNQGVSGILKAEKEQAKARTKISTQAHRASEKERRSQGRLSAALSRTKDKTRLWARQSDQSNKILGQSVRQIDRARLATKRLAGEQSKFPRLGGGGLGSVAAAAGLGLGVNKSLSDALSLEEAQVRLETVVQADDVEAAVAKITQEAERLAREGPISEIDALGVGYALSSAGLSAQAAFGGMSSVLKVAQITGGQAESVAETLATVMKNMGEGLEGSAVDKMARIGDVLTKTQLKFQFRDFGQLSEGFNVAAASAAAMAVPFEDLAVVMGQLNNAGIKGSAAGTAYEAIMRSMKKASQELGFDIVRNSEGQLDFYQSLQGLEEALSVYDDIDERAEVIQTNFGDEGKRGLLPLLAALKQAQGDLEDIKEGAMGVFDQEYQRFASSQGGQLTAALNSIGQLGTAIGTSLLPVINTLLTPVKGLAESLTSLVKQSNGLGIAIAGVTAALAAWKAKKMVAGGLGLLRELRGGPLGGGLRGQGTGGASGGGLLSGLGGRPIPVFVMNMKPWGMKPGGMRPGGALSGGGGAMGGKGQTTGKGGRFSRLIGRLGGGLRGQGAGGVLGNLLGGSLSRSGGKLLGRLATPLMFATSALEIGSALQSGDAKQTGGALGSLGGTLSGGLAGAAVGAGLGSVVPVVGTAIGGLLGGLVGSFGGEVLGENLGETLGSWLGNQGDDKAPKQGDQSQRIFNITLHQKEGQSAQDIIRELQFQTNALHDGVMP